MRLPSGENDRALRLRGDVRDLAALAALHVADPELQERRCPCRTSRRADVPSGDHDGSVSSAASLVRLTGLPPTGMT